MNINLDNHTQEVIKDFMEIDPIIGHVIKLAAETSYLKGAKDERDRYDRFILEMQGEARSEVL